MRTSFILVQQIQQVDSHHSPKTITTVEKMPADSPHGPKTITTVEKNSRQQSSHSKDHNKGEKYST